MMFEQDKVGEEAVKNLRVKLEQLVLYLNKIKEEKKSITASFNEQIRECDKKITCLAEALKTGDRTFLRNGFNQYEIESLMNGTLKLEVSAPGFE